ncbi:MAG: hypothetical protein US50_C0040G0005 [Candidatus Nomurabacteria bacterium GW2011_GWB1_37_5]|uniref:Uncharacterized protein n=1 Tax=Candidatus Nomurabacteria bacterium GW2011_GWB1_37_5 TaxID=1618742 RepID=A0A0G0GUK8_9BACT|nr:MAG: hypothetical protein US50_C0040G0005 [Candidatus Nomurabacteria bacterium GW2011_GWB1_37_5]
MINYLDIILLILIWLVGWGIYFYSGRKETQFTKSSELSFSYFIFLSLGTFYLFKNDLPDHISDYLIWYGAAMILVFLIVNHIYYSIRRHYHEPLLLEKNHPTDRWLQANRTAIFITSAHILFQQIVITFLILELYKFFPLQSVLTYFMVIFAILHLPLVYFKGVKFAALYTLPAAIAGLIFPFILIKLTPYGFILNYIIHWSFYALITYIFWRRQGKITIK